MTARIGGSRRIGGLVRSSRLLLVLVVGALVVGACGEQSDDLELSSWNTSSSTTTTTEPDEPDEPDDSNRSALARDDYVDRLDVAMFVTYGDIGRPAISCIAASLVDTVGLTRLEQAGIDPESFARAVSITSLGIDFSDDDVQRLADHIDGCVDLVDVMVQNDPDLDPCLVATADRPDIVRRFARALTLGDSFRANVAMLESATPECAEGIFLSSGVRYGAIRPEEVDCMAGALDDEISRRIIMSMMLEQPLPPDAAAQIQLAMVQCATDP